MELKNSNKDKEKYFLLNAEYDNSKSRIKLYFSRNPLSNNLEYIHKENYQPYFIINNSKEIISNLLSEFKGLIKIKELEKNKIKIISVNNIILRKCINILKYSLNKDILEIEPERQFLINNNWSYYDSFSLILKNKIRKVDDKDLIHLGVKKYLENTDLNIQKKLIEPITRKLIISNLLKTKPQKNIKSSQIINTLLENDFFKKDLIISHKSLVHNKNNFDHEITTNINKKLEDLKKSINITKKIHSNRDMINNIKNKGLQDNIQFIQYLTEYALLNNLIKEIPLFLENTNTKFYDKKIELKTKQTYLNLNKKPLNTNNKISAKVNNHRFSSKIQSYFLELNLPIPKIISN
jgi:Ni,Fe-hydrogenase III component G